MDKFEIEKKLEEISHKLVKYSKNNAPDLLENVSIWHILIFKAIVIAIIIYTCFIPIIQANYYK